MLTAIDPALIADHLANLGADHLAEQVANVAVTDAREVRRNGPLVLTFTYSPSGPADFAVFLYAMTRVLGPGAGYDFADAAQPDTAWLVSGADITVRFPGFVLDTDPTAAVSAAELVTA